MHRRPRLGTLLVGMLVGAAMLSPAWAASPPATKAFVKKQVKKVKAQLGTQLADRYTKGEADARYQQGCKDGAVLAFASVSANGQPQDGQFHPTTGFNCAGGSVEVKDVGAPLEEFIVRFTGLGLTNPNPDLVAIVTAKRGGITGTAEPGLFPDEIVVYLTGVDETSYDDDFSIAVLHA